MIRALVYVDPDLSSSIALRYTCQLAGMFEMEIQAIHAHEPEAHAHTGWARRTWEKIQLEESKKEIEQLLTAEKQFCPVSIQPIVVAGDPKKEIQEHLEKGGYDLFVEGIRRPLSTKNLAKKLQSSLYQTAPCPILLVQNLTPLNKVLLVIRERPTTKALLSMFSNLFKGAKWSLDAVIPEFLAQSVGDDEAQEVLKECGYEVENIHRIKTISEIEKLRDYGLVAIGVNRGKKDKGPLVEFVQYLPSPILFCWA